MHEIFWWIFIALWAVGFAAAATRWKYPASPGLYVAGVCALGVSILTDPKITGIKTFFLLCLIGLSMFAIGYCGIGMRKEVKKDAKQEVGGQQVDGGGPEEAQD